MKNYEIKSDIDDNTLIVYVYDLKKSIIVDIRKYLLPDLTSQDVTINDLNNYILFEDDIIYDLWQEYKLDAEEHMTQYYEMIENRIKEIVCELVEEEINADWDRLYAGRCDEKL